jgi:hypothetical protein
MNNTISRLQFSLAALLSGSLACGEPEPLGSVMLAITTDLYVDKDVSRVDILVQPEHGAAQSREFNLFPALGGYYLPGTFSIIEGSTPGEFVRVRVIARQGNAPRVVREAALRVPRQRTAVLSVPIQWLCDGHVRQDGQVTRSSCPENETCSSGACVSDAVAEEVLPDYLPEDIFGGGNATGGGTCFDTIPCFEAATQPELDLDTCVLEQVVSDDLNVGIRLPIGTDGHCTNRDCWVPIDRSPQSGWAALEGGTGVQLPAAVCQHVREGEASVRVSHECPSKTPGTPTCGDWTLVGTQPGGELVLDGAPFSVDDVSLAGEVITAATRLTRSVAAACASVAREAIPSELTPAEITRVCDAADGVLAAVAPLDWYHTTTRCWPDHNRQFACELACDAGCDPGTIEQRCDPSLTAGRCSEPCSSGECLGSEALPLDCTGACDGTCSGRCDGACIGQCEGTCDDPSPDGYCAGRCDGACIGLCQGGCDGTCQGTCKSAGSESLGACRQNTQCRGGCAGQYQAPVCISPLRASPCDLDAECAADCRAVGFLGAGCEPSETWIQPQAGLDPALRASLGDAIAALIPVRDVQGPALLQEGSRIAERLSDSAASSDDALAAANTLVRLREALRRAEAASLGASELCDAAGPPRQRSGAAPEECRPLRSSGTGQLIDDFEDGNGQVLPNDDRDGYWHIIRDDSLLGNLSMDEPPVPASGGANASSSAMHLSGSGFTSWGAGLSVDLRQEGNPYDASLDSGIEFWAVGNTPLRLVFIQQDLARGHQCATCPESSSECNLFYGTTVALGSEWTRAQVPWSSLVPSSANGTPFDPSRLMTIKFEAPPAATFEFGLDDLKLY